MAAAIFGAAGCGTGKNVLRGDEIAAASEDRIAPCDGVRIDADDPQVVRAYFDAEGELYPGLTVETGTPDAMFDERSTPLRETFRSPLAGHEGVWPSVLAELGVGAPDYTDPVDRQRAWTEAQIEIRSRIARDVDEATLRADGSRRPLFVFIHGYNTGIAECTYAAIRDRVERHVAERGVGGDFAYLYVAWDGLIDNGVTVWTKAQYNFPLVGQGLRRLLGSLPADLDVRAITHSSGGPVLAHALWDASGAEAIDVDECEGGLSGEAAYRDYLIRRMADELPPVPAFSDLRIGMIVPATPGAIFRYYGTDEARPDRLVIGFNDRDIVVGRGPLWCGLLGNTCLPVRASYACEVVERVGENPHTSVSLLDFSHSSKERRRSWLFWESHDFLAYLGRDDMEKLLDALLLDVPMPDEAAEVCRGVEPFEYRGTPPTAAQVCQQYEPLPQLSDVPRLEALIRLEGEAVKPGTAAYRGD